MLQLGGGVQGTGEGVLVLGTDPSRPLCLWSSCDASSRVRLPWYQGCVVCIAPSMSRTAEPAASSVKKKNENGGVRTGASINH